MMNETPGDSKSIGYGGDFPTGRIRELSDVKANREDGRDKKS